MTEDKPTYSLLLNGVEAADYFTQLQTRRYVRSQIGTFQISVDDDQFKKWAGLKEFLPVILSIDSTRIFKGRIDKIIRHYDKKENGFLTTVSGRDNGGALMDVFVGGYYYQATPETILIDLLSKYNAQKGSLDPTISAGTIHFHNDYNYTFTLSFDRQSVWDCIEQLCQAVEGQYAQTATPLFLDYWVDENDDLQLTRTGESDLNLDVGGYGGEYIKTSDWTIDALPIKTNVLVYGDPSGGFLPLTSDPYWVAVNGGVIDDAWTEASARDWIADIITPVNIFPTIQNVKNVLWPRFYPPINPGPYHSIQGVSISDSADAIMGNQSIKITVDPATIEHTFLSAGIATPLFYGQNAIYWAMHFDASLYPNAPWKDLCQQPLNHFNFYNVTRLNEAAGEVNAIQFWIKMGGSQIFDLDVFVLAIDGQVIPSGWMSQTVHYSPIRSGGSPFDKPRIGAWQNIQVPFGPHGGGSFVPTNQSGAGSKEFHWYDVQEIEFGFNLSPLASIDPFPFDIYFDGLRFVKQIVAQGKPVPTDTVRTAPITDTKIPNYQFAAFKANAYRRSLALSQNYVDYLIFGRPDLQVGHTFKAQGEKVLIRESITGATKLGGYIISVKAWKPLP